MMMINTLFLLTLAINAVNIVSGAPPKVQVVTRCTVPNTAALTFDDGPWVYLYDISRSLKASNATGTFFFNGDNYGCIYDTDLAKRVKFAYDKGHQVASHTWSHAHVNNLNWDQLHHEFWLMEEAIMKITGAYPSFVRPPYGENNDLVRKVAASRGQSLVLWDFDSGDSEGLTTDQSKARYTQIGKTHPNTLLALNHETHKNTALIILPHAITVLKNKGYRLVTLAECLGRPAYKWVGAPQKRDNSWTCAGKK